jgi:phosphoribosylanthranilate isomerase
MLWVKICGMTSVEDAIAAAEAGADAIGFIFAPSKRQISFEAARSIVQSLPKTVDKVGVFSNASVQQVEDTTTEVGLTAVQLHGDESPEFARTLFRHKGQRSRAQMRVFKTLHVTNGVEGVAREFLMNRCVDGFLLDSVIHNPTTGETERGGTGQTFDWRRANEFLPGMQRGTRIIVAGGLSPANVGEAVRVLQPWGVDACSGVEREPRKKDWAKVRAFITAAREARN